MEAMIKWIAAAVILVAGWLIARVAGQQLRTAPANQGLPATEDRDSVALTIEHNVCMGALQRLFQAEVELRAEAELYRQQEADARAQANWADARRWTRQYAETQRERAALQGRIERIDARLRALDQRQAA